MKKKSKKINKKRIYKGFIAPKIDETHYFLGAGLVPQVVLQPNSDWTDSLPETEKQRRQFETFNCTSFNTLNAIEMLMFKKFGQRVNYSDRWVGIVAGTSAKKGGNDPHVVCEAIRKHGLIPEEMLPYTDDLKTAEEYYSFKGADEEACKRAGEEWKRQYEFKHEWVFKQNQPLEEKMNNMKVALKYSPLALSVYAWEKSGEVYISGGRENHWTSKFAQPKYSNIFDSYDPFIKAVDQNFSFCKRFSIEKQATKEEIGGFIQILKGMLIWLNLLPTPSPQAPQPLTEPITREKVYKIARESVGVDVSPSDTAPDDLACVESVCQILAKAGIETPKTLSTLTFYNWLKKSPKFKQTTEEKRGNIIISPTGKGNGSVKHGHVGIFGDNGWVLSNDSPTGLWLENYSLQSWVARFRTKGGYPIYYFEAL